MIAPTFIDLCAGAGGMTRGLVDAGLTPVLAVERDEDAAATYHANFPQVQLLHEDFASMDLSRVPTVDVVSGTLPLDGFGTLRSSTRPASRIWPAFASVVSTASASVFVVDAARGLLGERALAELTEAVEEVGAWSIQTNLVRTTDFGAATAESRALVVGTRTPMSWDLSELLQAFARPAHSVRDRIWDLRDLPLADQPAGRVESSTGTLIEEAHAAHRSGHLSERWLEYARRMGPGDRLEAVLGTEDTLRMRTVAKSVSRLTWDDPAPRLWMASGAGIGPFPVHPEQDRRVSALETALLRGFPVDYRWQGGLASVYRQVTMATNVDWARVVGGVAMSLAEGQATGPGTSPDVVDLTWNVELDGVLFEFEPGIAAVERQRADELAPSPDLLGVRGALALGPGGVCVNDRAESHTIEAPADDSQLQTVARWLEATPDVVAQFGDAVESAVYYVLDGSRTHRFDLDDPAVDSDERRTVGTKLQYYIIDNLGLEKLRHPDTRIDGVGVELKGTIGSNWTIPREGQCGVTLLSQVDTRRWRHRTRLMRTHRAWLRDGANNDGKRGVRAQALQDYSLLVYDWRDLRPNPLTRLTVDERAVVFGKAGQEKRLIALFSALPDVVVPRAVVLTVCANRDDPLRRVRAIRPQMARRGRALLCGQWVNQRQIANQLGFDLTGAAWVSVPWDDIGRHGSLSSEVYSELEATPQ